MRLSLCTCALAAIAVGAWTTSCSSKAAETAKDAAASSDLGPVDTCLCPPDTVASEDAAAPQDVIVPPKDTAAPGLACIDLLACASACPAVAAGADNPCAKVCGAQGTAAATAALDAFGSCTVSLCADVTETHARIACSWSKCFDKMSACGEFGTGAIACGSTAACFERCLPGDFTCRYGCLQNATKEGAASFKDLGACVQGKCGAIAEGQAKAACIASNCVSEANACKGAGFDCLGEQACLAKCPVPLPNKPNTCEGMCGMLASGAGTTASDAYINCQTQCAGSINIPDCVKTKCGAQQTACFAGSGTQSCQTVYNCVKDKCDGIGGDEACIAGCLADGTAPAKDAYIQYEGCILKLLGTQQAKRAGCVFPYDETTCLGPIKDLCSNQSNACFQPN